MNDKHKQIKKIPEEFASYEEAADFWDNHDTTNYADEFETVDAEVELKRRRYEIEIDADLIPALTEQAHQRGIAVKSLVSEMLRDKLTPAA
ncbi:MAG: BrnA antitoxin family protein [Acidobacteriota bacterium]|nr:BrnA antitoxin family protein [Acidobacteriota bacterium]